MLPSGGLGSDALRAAPVLRTRGDLLFPAETQACKRTVVRRTAGAAHGPAPDGPVARPAARRALSLGVARPRRGADVQPSSRAVRVAAGPPVWGVRCVTQRGMPWPPEEPQAGSHVGCCSRYEMKGHTVTPPTPQDLTSSINRVPGPG